MEGGGVGGYGWAVLSAPGFTRLSSPRGIRMTAPTSSAGPPARAPPGRSASAVTPRPCGRPSTTAVQVHAPRGLFYPREALLLVAFPLMSLSLTLAPGETTDRAWDCQWAMESPSF